VLTVYGTPGVAEPGQVSRIALFADAAVGRDVAVTAQRRRGELHLHRPAAAG
jgi:hypothetical protein